MQIEFTKESITKFNSLLLEMQQVTKAEMPKIIRNATRDYIFKAIEATPLSEKTVNVIPIKTAGGKVYFKRSTKSIPIKGRGFARACWVKALEGVGLKPKTNWHLKSKKKAILFGDAKMRERDEYIEFEFANQCPYIEDLDRRSRIAQQAMNETNKKMEQILTKLSLKMASKWR
jgi:hypothetical protein